MVNNKDKKIIGFDRETGFPIYGEVDVSIDDSIRNNENRKTKSEKCFFAGTISFFIFLLFPIITKLVDDLHYIIGFLSDILMLFCYCIFLASTVICIKYFFEGKKNSIAFVGLISILYIFGFSIIEILGYTDIYNDMLLFINLIIYIFISIITVLFLKNKLSKKLKKRMYIMYGIVFIPIIIFFICYLMVYKNDYSNSIYVITRKEGSYDISYYEVNDRRNIRRTDKFEHNSEIIYLKGCFNSYIDHKKNKVLNKYNKICQVVDSNYNHIKNNKDIDSIIKLMAKLEHDMIEPKIIKTKNNYYVVVPLNVNWHSPYDLYKYENNKLKFIYTFESEDIIGIKDDSSNYCKK